MTAKNLAHSTPWTTRAKSWWRLRKGANSHAKALLWAIFTGQAIRWQEKNPHITFFNIALDDQDRKDLSKMLHAKDAEIVSKGTIADMFGPAYLIEEALIRQNPKMLDDVLWAVNVADIFHGQGLASVLASAGLNASADDKRWITQHVLERLENMTTFQDPLSHGLSVAMGAARLGQKDLILWLWSKNLLPKHPKDVTDRLCQSLMHTPSGQLLHKILSGMSHHDAIKLTAQAAGLNEKDLIFKSN